MLNILVGGVDTTQSQLSHMIRLLAGKPDQWQALRENPDELVPRAVSEALRNIARHAGTDRVRIRLADRRDRVVVLISDDGRGFDAATRGSGLWHRPKPAPQPAAAMWTRHSRAAPGGEAPR